jgi:hypothetical protein
MKGSDRSLAVDLVRLKKEEKSGRNHTIDLKKLKLIVSGKKKKWMKSNERSERAEIYRLM